MHLLAIGLWLSVDGPLAQEPLLGRVLALEDGRMVISMATHHQTLLRLPLEAIGDPRGLVPGSLVRVWLGSEGNADSIRINPVVVSHGRDPSGVRTRLSRGLGRGARAGRGGR